MATRAIVAGAALAVSLTSSVVLSPVSADDGPSCSDAFLMPGTTAAGVVWDEKPEDWWEFTVAPGRYVVTLTSSVADADLGVADENCKPTCERDAPVGIERCTVDVDAHGLTVVARSRSHDVPASYVIEVATVRPASAPDCVDGIDNDGDHMRDWGNDAGCESPADPSENDSPCYDVANVAVCVEAEATGRGRPGPFVHVGTKKHEIAGYIDTYAFDVGRERVTVPCVVLVAKPRGTFSPCKLNGKFVSREMTLFRPIKEDLPSGSVGPKSFYVCPATVTVSVGSSSPHSFPAYTLC